MKTWRKLGALLCAMSFVFALAGCGGGEAAKTAKLIAIAEKNVAEAKSMQADMTMDMDMTLEAEGQSYPIKSTTKMNMLLINNPMKVKMDMEEQLGIQNTNQTMYLVENNGTYTLYTPNDTQWASEIMESSSLNQYSPQESLSFYLKNAESFQVVGKETLKGLKTKKYTGVISSEVINQLMSDSSVVSTLSAIDIEDIDLQALYSDLGSVPISLWVNEEGYPVRYQMDMTEMVNKHYSKVIEQFGEEVVGGNIICSKFLVSMDISNYDKVEDFALPTGIAQ